MGVPAHLFSSLLPLAPPRPPAAYAATVRPCWPASAPRPPPPTSPRLNANTPSTWPGVSQFSSASVTGYQLARAPPKLGRTGVFSDGAWRGGWRIKSAQHVAYFTTALPSAPSWCAAEATLWTARSSTATYALLGSDTTEGDEELEAHTRVNKLHRTQRGCLRLEHPLKQFWVHNLKLTFPHPEELHLKLRVRGSTSHQQESVMPF